MEKREPTTWPSLALKEWQDTCATLHMRTQIVGKIREQLTPLVNHWWNVPLYVNARGLTTSLIPYGNRPFELTFDFLDHQLVLQSSGGARSVLPLGPMAVAGFYQKVMEMVRANGIEVKIWDMPAKSRIPSRSTRTAFMRHMIPRLFGDSGKFY